MKPDSFDSPYQSHEIPKSFYSEQMRAKVRETISAVTNDVNVKLTEIRYDCGGFVPPEVLRENELAENALRSSLFLILEKWTKRTYGEE